MRIRIASTLAAIVLLTACTLGASRITATLTVTNIPAAGNSIQVNADGAKSWVAAVTTPASEILIGSGASSSATNLYRHFGSYPPTGTPVVSQTASNVVRFIGAPGNPMTLTLVGSWGAVGYVTNSVGTATNVIVPFGSYPSSGARTAVANQLALDLDTWATSPFSVGTALLTNYVDRSTAQVVVGAKTLMSVTTSNLVNYGSAISSPGAGTASQQFGAGSAANGDRSLAVGTASVGGDDAVGIGVNTVANADDAVAIGRLAAATAPAALAVGTGAAAGDTNAVSIGSGAISSGQDAMAFGTGSSASGDYSIAIGTGTEVTHTNAIAIGIGASSSADNQVVLGSTSQTVLVPGAASITNLIAGNLVNYGNPFRSAGSGTRSEQIGTSAAASGNDSVAVGYGASAGGASSIAIGASSSSSANDAITIGSATAAGTNSVAIGRQAYSGTANQIVLGTNIHTVSIPGHVTIADDTTLTETRFTRVDNASLANGNNAGVDPGNTAYMRITAGPTGAFAICGIAGGADGRVIFITNATGQHLTIANDSGVDPTATNRIYTETGSDWTSTGNCGLILIYDSSAARWRLIGKSE